MKQKWKFSFIFSFTFVKMIFLQIPLCHGSDLQRRSAKSCRIDHNIEKISKKDIKSKALYSRTIHFVNIFHWHFLYWVNIPLIFLFTKIDDYRAIIFIAVNTNNLLVSAILCRRDIFRIAYWFQKCCWMRDMQ